MDDLTLCENPDSDNIISTRLHESDSKTYSQLTKNKQKGHKRLQTALTDSVFL